MIVLRFFVLLFSPELQPHLRWVFPPQFTLSRKSLIDNPEVCVLGNSRSCLKLMVIITAPGQAFRRESAERNEDLG